eukprot:10880589-Heterocapsa_arctica.AAC.1
MDRAGDETTRCSLSRGCIFQENYVVKTWVKIQHVVALSSVEAELHAGNRAATECIGVQGLMNDPGDE